VAVLAGALFIADRIAVNRTESAIASRIEKKVPGSHAKVTISSSPFLLNLAMSGTVKQMHAHVTNVTAGRLTLDTVDVTVHNLKVSRSDLFHGSVKLTGMSEATIQATMSVAQVIQASLGAAIGLPSGSSASVEAGPSSVRISFGPFAFTVPYTSIVPCVGTARVSGAEVVLTCTTHTLPPALKSA
jgi:LmeA-like phospholipid-binding